MRSLISLSFVFLTAILSGLEQASALTARSCDAGSELCSHPYPQFFKRQVTPIIPERVTNAQRLARGLPLKPPARRSPTLAARTPQTSAVPQITYLGVIEVLTGTTLGYLAPDPNNATPQITTDIVKALQISFQLPSGSTSGSQLSLTQLNDGRGTYFGLVVGTLSTDSNISVGNSNYLTLDPVSATTDPGATPQSIPSYESVHTGSNKQAETSVWNVDLVTGDLTAQWVNTDSSTPSTFFFAQNNHVYAGGDANTYHLRFPSGIVTHVTLQFVPT